MKRTLIALFLGVFFIVAGACTGQSSADAPSATPSSVAVAPARDSLQTGRFLAIREVGLGPDGYVALANYTDSRANLDGLFLCQGVQCVALPDVVVPAEETARVAVGDTADLEGIVVDGTGLGELRPSDGEVGLYASGDLDNPGAMLLYYQWGSTPHELTQTAIEAGLWVEGGYGPSSPNATRLFKVEETGLWLFEE